jgi:hypothetical protein
MTVADIKAAKGYIERLYDIDKDISRINQYAKKIVDKSLCINLALSYHNCTEPNPDIIKSEPWPLGIFRSLQEPWLQEIKDANLNYETVAFEISEVVSLQVLGVIVAHKEGERMALIAELKRIGFEITL